MQGEDAHRSSRIQGVWCAQWAYRIDMCGVHSGPTGQAECMPSLAQAPAHMCDSKRGSIPLCLGQSKTGTEMIDSSEQRGLGRTRWGGGKLYPPVQ